MKKWLIQLLWVASLFGAQAAHATFHLWQVAEIYSNASGTVQYVMLTSAAGGQNFMSGQTITGAKTYSFTTNLSGDTTNKKLLIATQGFAALGLVTPDYVAANNFLATTNGSVNFANIDIVSYKALPSDGVSALDRTGKTVTAAPTNFAGATAALPNPLDCLFNWAEKTYPSLLTPTATSKTQSPYYYRFYSASNIYVGGSSTDSKLYYLDGSGLRDLGLQSTWLTTAGCQ